VILGGGRVGRAAAESLEARGMDWRIVEREPGRVQDEDRVVLGDAGDLEALKKAGLLQAPAVLITTHDDNLNMYLTIYCRSLRPDIQIISRATLERTAELMKRAGADMVLSYASMGATAIFNQIQRSQILTVAEGIDIFRVKVPESLAGKTIVESGVREETGCTIVAVREDGKLTINPPADTLLHSGGEMIVAGTIEAETEFLRRFGEESR